MKISDGKILVPAWVAQKSREMLGKMSGEHAGVYVGQIALMGPDGYSLGSIEEAVDLDPRSFGPLMIQGYNFLGGQALGKLMESVVNELRSDRSEIHDKAREMAEELVALRNREIEEALEARETDPEVDVPDAIGQEEAEFEAYLDLARNAATAAIRQYLIVVFNTAGMRMQEACEPHDRIVAGVSQALGMWATVSQSPIMFQQPKQEPIDGN